MRVGNQDTVHGGVQVQRFRQEMARILRRVEWPTDIEYDPVAIRSAEFDAVTADLVCGAVDS